jgi:hypothetical protein
VWHAITDFLLKAHTAGLGHDAVIEIMIALLGLMIAVLTLIAGLFAAIVAIVGVFGFQTIRDEAKAKAKETAIAIAEKTARHIASGIAQETVEEIRERAQASGLTESQATERTPSVRKRKTGITKATTDKGLKDD